MASLSLPTGIAKIYLPQHDIGFKVPKDVLSGRSNFFKAAVVNGMKETHQNRIELVAYEPETVRIFLLWLETKDIFLDEEVVLDDDDEANSITTDEFDFTTFDEINSTTTDEANSTTSDDANSTTTDDANSTTTDKTSNAAEYRLFSVAQVENDTDSKVDVALNNGNAAANEHDNKQVPSSADKYYKGHLFDHSKQIVYLYKFAAQFDIRALRNLIVTLFQTHCPNFCLLHDHKTAALLDHFFVNIATESKLFKMVELMRAGTTIEVSLYSYRMHLP